MTRARGQRGRRGAGHSTARRRLAIASGARAKLVGAVLGALERVLAAAAVKVVGRGDLPLVPDRRPGPLGGPVLGVAGFDGGRGGHGDSEPRRGRSRRHRRGRPDGDSREVGGRGARGRGDERNGMMRETLRPANERIHRLARRPPAPYACESFWGTGARSISWKTLRGLEAKWAARFGRAWAR
jgi:hypothetical protein